MNKKIIFLLPLLMVNLFTINESKNNFTEGAIDLQNNTKLNSKILLQNNKEIDYSNIFIQNGTSSDGKNCLRFAIALKGNIEKLSFLRGHVDCKNDVNEIEVKTIYRSIEANNYKYYYSQENGLTTDENYAGEYYWACYTIRYLDDTFNNINIPLTVKINDYTLTRKASLSEAIYGNHEHIYSKYKYDEISHYKYCELCNTIDETSMHEHDYMLNAKFNNDYEINDAYNSDNLMLEEECECGKSLGNVDYKYVTYPNNVLLGDSVEVKTKYGNRNIVLPINETKKMSKNDTELKYGGGNAGIVGQETDFRFKESYKIVDGKFALVGNEGDYSYGNVFINIDMNIKNNPYIQFPITLNNDANIKFIISCSNNSTYKNNVKGSYEQELKRCMSLLIDGEEIDYNDIMLKAIPQTALDEINLNNENTAKKYIYFTFEEYELTTTLLNKGTHTIRFNFKNGYENDIYKSLDADQPCVGCINYFRFETVNEVNTKVELENNLMVSYTDGVKKDGGKVTPKSKLNITRLEDGTYKYVNKKGEYIYDTYQEAYQVAYNAASAAGKTTVKNASNGDFLAYIDGKNSSFTVNLKNINKTKYDLYLKGASNWAFNMKNWMPYQVGDMILSDFMKLEINGVEKNLDNNLILPGCGDGSKGDNSYWANWVLLNLGEINLDPSLEINTIKFSFIIDNSLDEKGNYKYLYNNNYAFGQYDYILLK